jgi:hypothetical protein
MNTNNWKWAEVGPEPRSAGRRFIETELRLDHARSNGASRTRIAVLERGYAMLDMEFTKEVRSNITRDLFRDLGRILSPTAQRA